MSEEKQERQSIPTIATRGALMITRWMLLMGLCSIIGFVLSGEAGIVAARAAEVGAPTFLLNAVFVLLAAVFLFGWVFVGWWIYIAVFLTLWRWIFG